jgi:hypothetical protein
MPVTFGQCADAGSGLRKSPLAGATIYLSTMSAH